MPAQWANLIHKSALGEAGSALFNVPVIVFRTRREPLSAAQGGRELSLIVTQAHQPATRSPDSPGGDA